MQGERCSFVNADGESAVLQHYSWECMGTHGVGSLFFCGSLRETARGGGMGDSGRRRKRLLTASRVDDGGSSECRATLNRKKTCLALDILIPHATANQGQPKDGWPVQADPGDSVAEFRLGAMPTGQGSERLSVRLTSETSKINNKRYTGDWAISSWNAQGLMATESIRHHEKMRRARNLFSTQDVLVLQETHGTVGKCKAARITADSKAWWSHGEDGSAGVGIWIKHSFIH